MSKSATSSPRGPPRSSQKSGTGPRNPFTRSIRRTSDQPFQRSGAAEASALRFMLSEQMKQTRTGVIVLGDINDSQHSNTVNILTEQPRYLVGDSVGGGDTSLYTGQTLQEYRNKRDVYYTHIHQDIMESLDHILVSEEFYDNSRKRVWLFDGMTIANDHLNAENHKETGTGDHGIICASFKFRPMKAEAAMIVGG